MSPLSPRPELTAPGNAVPGNRRAQERRAEGPLRAEATWRETPSYTAGVPPKPPKALLDLQTKIQEAIQARNPMQRQPDPTGRRSISVSRRIDAPAARIFALLADPRRHPDFDGSGTVTRLRPGAPTRLGPGVQFGVEMNRGVSYRVVNTVKEFDEGRRIAWAHRGGHRWRFSLERLDDGGTLVTETFDWSTAVAPAAIEKLGFPEKNRPGMEATLARIEQIVTSDTAGH